jgi:hypothetical protein
MQEQNTMYLSALWQTDFDTNLLENITCEAIRFKKLQEYQKNPKDNNTPIQATDMYFPGQTYYETRGTQVEGYHQRVFQPVWNSSLGTFACEFISFTSTSTPAMLPNNQGVSLKAGKLATKQEQPGSDIQYFVDSGKVDPAVYRDIKKAFVKPHMEGETMPTYQRRICSLVGTLIEPHLWGKPVLGKGKKMVKQRQAVSLTKWEAEVCEWNKQKPPGLRRAHQRHEELLQLQLRLAIQPRTPARTASPTTNMSPASLLPTQLNVVSPGMESTTAPEGTDP